MAVVQVTIAGRAYRMACGEGEEAHLQELGRHVDSTITELRKGFGEVGDNRLVIMTAITLTDDLFETRRRLAEAEEKLAGFTATRSEGGALRDALAVEVADTLDGASARLEQLAQKLNDAGKGRDHPDV